MKDLEFGRRVRARRLALGMSQGELAKAIARATGTKATKSVVSRWELGRVANPHMATVFALGKILDVDLAWLMLGRGNAVPSEDKQMALPSRGLQIDTLTRAIEVALQLKLRSVARTSEAAALFYSAICTSKDISDETLLSLAAFNSVT